jgi:hypothetical protein
MMGGMPAARRARASHTKKCARSREGRVLARLGRVGALLAQVKGYLPTGPVI